MPRYADARSVHALRAGRRSGARAPAIAPVAMAWLFGSLAACATTCSHPRGPEADWLGPVPRSGCFHVALAAPKTYRFVIDDMVYPRAQGAGDVAIIVHAVSFGDLAPRPIRLHRDSRLEFVAQGEASGAFVLRLFLVDGQGRETKPSRLDIRCANPPKGP